MNFFFFTHLCGDFTVQVPVMSSYKRNNYILEQMCDLSCTTVIENESTPSSQSDPTIQQCSLKMQYNTHELIAFIFHTNPMIKFITLKSYTVIKYFRYEETFHTGSADNICHSGTSYLLFRLKHAEGGCGATKVKRKTEGKDWK